MALNAAGNLVGGRLFALCFGSVQHADTIDGLTNHAVQRGGDFSLNAGTDTVAFHIRRENTLLLLLGHQRLLSACNTSAFESLERVQRAHAIMPAHSINTATVYITPVKNAAVLLDAAETGFVRPTEAVMAPNKVMYPC